MLDKNENCYGSNFWDTGVEILNGIYRFEYVFISPSMIK